MLLLNSCDASQSRSPREPTTDALGPQADAVVLPVDASVSDLQWTAADTLGDSELCSAGGEIVPRDVCCATRVPMPLAARTVIDLRVLPADTVVFCMEPSLGDDLAVQLPADPAAYPVKVLLPSRTTPHPRCAAVCNAAQRETLTALSVRFHMPLSNREWAPTLVASSPWQLINSGDGDPDSDRCIGGYQEFGVRSCLRIPYGDQFGVGTPTLAAAPGELLVDIAPKSNDFSSNCCPYLPRTP